MNVYFKMETSELEKARIRKIVKKETSLNLLKDKEEFVIKSGMAILGVKFGKDIMIQKTLPVM